MANVNSSGGLRYDITSTWKIADSQSLTVMDPVIISSGKVAKYNTAGIVPATAIGFASETKSMGVLATVGQQSYVGVRRKGLMQFDALKDTGSYTGDIPIGTRVSLYCDGSGNYYVVNNNTNVIGDVVEGSVDTATTTTTVLVEVDLTTEQVQAGEINWPLLVPTTKKIEFYDTGMFIHASADGVLTISSDGSSTGAIKITGNVTIDDDLVVGGTASIPQVGGTFTGTVQINDNNALQFEGVAATANGLALDCDVAGDATILCVAGMIDFSTKDGVVRFADSDVGTDYLDIIAGSGSSLQIFAAEPGGLFRFKDAGDANNSDVLDLTLTDAGGANKMTSSVAFEIETTAGAIVLDAATDISLDPAGADVHLLGAGAGKITMGATSVSIYGGDTGGDDLILYANSSDADPTLSLLGGAGINALILDQDFRFQYDTSNYLKVEVSSAGVATFTGVTATTDGITFVTAAGNITLTSAADIVMTAGGNDITMDAQLSITATAADQFVIAYDGSNYFNIDVDADGSTTLSSTGNSTADHFEIATGTAGNIILDAAGGVVLEAANNSITADSPITITDTAVQLNLNYDATNYISIGASSVGSGTLTTVASGAGPAHFEIMTGTSGNIILDAAGDVILEAAGGDVTCDAQLTITNTSADQFVIQYDGTHHLTFDVDSDGSTTLTTAGSGSTVHFEIATGTTGNITLDAAGAIELESATNSIIADSPITITDTAAAQLNLHYDATNYISIGASDVGSGTLMTVASGAGPAHFEIMTGTSGNIILDAAGDIALEAAGGDITADAQLTITNTSADQFIIAYDTTHHLTFDVDSDGSTTLTTAGSGSTVHFEIATGTTGDITLDAEGAVVFESATNSITADSPITITDTAAAQLILKYDATNYISIGVSDVGSGTLITVASGAGPAHFEIMTGTSGNIILDAAGDIELEADTNVTGDFAYTGHKDGQILICNTTQIIDADWVHSGDGTTRMPASKTDKEFYIPVHGLKVGDEVTGFRLLGQIESAANTVQLNADFRKVATGTADVADSSVAVMDEIEKTADFRVDSGSTFTAETIVVDTGYYILVSGTTAANTDIVIIGAEFDVNRK